MVMLCLAATRDVLQLIPTGCVIVNVVGGHHRDVFFMGER